MLKQILADMLTICSFNLGEKGSEIAGGCKTVTDTKYTFSYNWW
jgi:hypothetical protein